jgi:hypothetical protein
MEHDPYEENRSLPKVDYASLEYRLYRLASACYAYLDANDPKQKALKQLCNDLPQEYEERAMRNHKERN